MNPLLDALGSVGYALDTPGALLRGALAGRAGERASGQDLLSSYGLSSADDPWGGLKGFGAEALLDPLALAGPALGAFKGIQGVTRGARTLAHADDVNPLAKAVARFAGDESGAIALPRARELIKTSDNPLGRFQALAEHSPAEVSLNPVHQTENFGAYPWEDPAAVYLPDAVSPAVVPNLQLNQWGDPGTMEEMVRRIVRSGQGAGPVSADSFPVHELGHAFHDRGLREAGNRHGIHTMLGKGSIPSAIAADIRPHLGQYATTNPAEFVAEAFTNQMLRGEPLPAQLRSLYQDFHGPDLDQLPPEFLRAWWNLPKL